MKGGVRRMSRVGEDKIKEGKRGNVRCVKLLRAD